MRIIIPLGRSYSYALSVMETVLGIDSSLVARNEREYVFNVGEYEFIFIKPNDLLKFCDWFDFDYAFVGSDLFEDWSLSNPTSKLREHDRNSWGTQRVSLVTNTHDISDVRVIYTPYVGVAKHYYPNKEVRDMKSSLELYPCLSHSNAIIDVVETGYTLELHNLVELEELFKIDMLCITK